jgi:hypothetical protein
LRPETSAEHERLRRADAGASGEDWRLFGPYLSERQWGTVREDYSATGACWDYFPHDHARSRAYRWGEDGLLGFSDREARLCFGLGLWNGRDPILKERLFGLAAPEGNHGEDVKELYYYLDATPTASYAKALYKYPLWAYPYGWLVRENGERNIDAPEFEIEDTGIFDRNRYIDVTAEYAKASPTDVAIRLTLENRGGDDALLHVLPQIWFRNTWSWGRDTERGYPGRPQMRVGARRCVALAHPELGRYFFEVGTASDGAEPDLLFTENETNMERLFGAASPSPWVKDAFHEYVVGGRADAVNPAAHGTKAAAHYRLSIPARGSVTLLLRLASEADVQARLGLRHIESTLRARIEEADAFHATVTPNGATDDERNVLRQGYASLLWSRQFYNLDVAAWIDGDPAQPAPPAPRLKGRNHDWRHLENHDILSMPDKWEYPWYAAWDLAFHMIPLARVDPSDARRQLRLLLEPRSLHPSGQLPAYEFAFSDVNPPVHAWSCLRVFEAGGEGDPESRAFLRAVFEPLTRNFEWWQRIEAVRDGGLPGGGFLGLDNIGAFERGVTPPLGGRLEQADGAGWLAFFALNMLDMAMRLGRDEPEVYEPLALRFLEAFEAMAQAINREDGAGLWHEEDGFYYDHVKADAGRTPLRIRSMVGLIPMFAALALDSEAGPEGALARMPALRARIAGRALLAIPSREQLGRLLEEIVDEASLLAPTGVRSLSKRHRAEPFVLNAGGAEYRVTYAPEDSRTQAFGINSNWRGPVWFPLNHLLVEALRTYHRAAGPDFRIECPKGSGRSGDLESVARELESRLASTFLRGPRGTRPCHGDATRYATDPHFRDLVLFYEYFSGDTGRGFGASHQTGWSTLSLSCVENRILHRREVLP